MKSKTLIIGLDGATFDIIQPLKAEGKLPNIASLMDRGVYGKLESTLPPLTPVAWTTCATGVNPGKHGVYDVILYDRQKNTFNVLNASTRKVKPVWSILSERGKKTGVINIPLTYPVDPVNGFHISGMFTPSNAEDFTYPQQLKSELQEKFGPYIFEPHGSRDPENYLKSIHEMITFREEVVLYLLEKQPWDLFFTVFIASDRVQHFYWKYKNPAHPGHEKYKNAIVDIYQLLDKTVGKLVEKAGSDTNVILVSDHGAGPLEATFFLNNWLLKHGYLSLNEELGKVMKPGILPKVKSGVRKIADKFGLKDVLSPKFPQEKQSEQKSINLFCSLINFEKTLAFSEGGAGSIYLNKKKLKGEELHKVTHALINDLKNITDPRNGKKVFQEVYRSEDIYTGDYVSDAPDLTVVFNEGYQIIGPNDFLIINEKYEDALFLQHSWSGRHEQHGIFIINGPQIKKDGSEISNCHIADIMPTVLYLMGEEIPEYVDGKVLTSAINKDFLDKNAPRFTAVDQKTPEQHVFTTEEEADIAERLRGLGYIE